MSSTAKAAAVAAVAGVAALLFFLLQGKPAPAPPSSNAPPIREKALVTKVLDGDTILIQGGASVRLLGLDADERDHPCYEAAQSRLEGLVLNQEVELERDVEDRDRYGRMLRHVFRGRENISLRMVAEGYAVARESLSNARYREEIAAAEAKARETKAGCKWGGVGAVSRPTTDDRRPTTDKGAPAPDAPTPTPAPAPAPDGRWKRLAGNAIQACSAEGAVGTEAIVEGVVVEGRKAAGGTIFLNFGAPFPQSCFAGVIYRSLQEKFPPDPHLRFQGKTVRLKGMVKKYKTAQIELYDPGQIEIEGE